MDNEIVNSDLDFNLPPNKSSVIKVLGIGGGGSNAVNHMKTMGIKDVDFIICNTDAQALSHSSIENRVQLGASLTEGLGAGANPEVGKNAALESLEEIKQIIEPQTKMLFITAGMGGGTGTGAAPIIAKLARELNLLTVAVVTMPFTFEGKSRMKQAEEGLVKLREQVDSLIIIRNDKLREVYGNLGFKAGFSKADVILATGVKAIAEVITHHYRANIDLEDAKRVLEKSGTAIMGSAIAEGENRAQAAITKALDSPLLNDNHIRGAKNVLLLIVSGNEENEITFDEIAEINEHIQSEAGGDTNIILGIGQDDNLEKRVGVTVIATGFEKHTGSTVNQVNKTKKIIPLGSEEDKFEANEAPARAGTNPLDTPIASTSREEVENKAISQTDLFADVTPAEEKIELPIQESQPKVNTILTEESEEEVFTTSFELESSNENEVILEVESTIEETETFEAEIQPEEIIEEVQETVLSEEIQVEPETNIVEETSFVVEVESVEEPINEVIDEPIIEENETGFSFNISEEVEEVESESNEDFKIVKKDDFVIVDEEPEIKTPIDRSIKNLETKMDPLNFSIDQVIGKPKEDNSPVDQPLPIEETIEPEDTIKEKEVIKHDLEDLLELEQILNVKKSTPKEKIKEVIAPAEEEIEFKVTTKEETDTLEEINPAASLESTPNKTLLKERKSRLMEFNHSFKESTQQLHTPTYKRAGIDIQNDGFSTDSPLSRTVVNGEGKNIGFGGNSFLHDNVD